MGHHDDDDDSTPSTDLAAGAVKCLREISGRGMGGADKIALLSRLDEYRRMTMPIGGAGIDLDVVDGTHIDVVIETAELVGSVGVELLDLWDARLSAGASDLYDPNSPLPSLLRIGSEAFLRCLSYDDIDVSGAVVPLASRLTSTMRREDELLRSLSSTPSSSSSPPSFPLAFRSSDLLRPMLSIAYRRMRYPADFAFDPEDDEEAEEGTYRESLRKLYRDVVRARPDDALRFLVEALSDLSAPLGGAPAEELEAALRLVYHHCEGVRPTPGMRTLLGLGRKPGRAWGGGGGTGASSPMP